MRKSIKHQNLLWTNINSLDSKDANYIHEKFDIHHLNLEDCFSESEQPKIDEYGDYLFLVLRIPFYNKNKQKATVIKTQFFLGKDFLISIHDKKIDKVEKFFEKLRTKKETRDEYFSKGTSFILYKILSKTFDLLGTSLDNLLLKSRRLEKEIFETKDKRVLLKKIMDLKRDAILFRRLISPARFVLVSLEHKHKKYVKENFEFYFDDIVDSVEKIWSLLEALKETTENMQDTVESLISHETNDVIKVLTIFSAIMLPLTFITSFYGMNVHLPFEDSEYAFEIIGGITIFCAILMFIYFKIKKLL